MTSRTDVERLLDRYLAEGAEQVPERVIDAALAQIDHTRQRRALRAPWRFDDMASLFKLALAGAAVVAVLAVGTILLIPRPTANVGGPPAATPSPTAAPTLLPTAGGTEVGPGRYFRDFEGYRFTFTVVGRGWTIAWPNVIAKYTEDDGPENAALAIWGTPSIIWAGCDWRGTEPLTPGPTVDDFVSALAAQRGWETSEPIDVTVDGYEGKRLQLQVPDDMDHTECDANEYRSYEERVHSVAGEVDDLWILDLDGSRHVLVKTYRPGTPMEWRNEMDQMVASMEIEPAP